MGEALRIPGNAPSFQCLSTDISGSTIPGGFYKGANIYFTDTEKWYRVLDDLTLVPLVYQVSGSVTTIVSGSISANITSGSVAVTNFPTTFSGSITNLPVEYPVSGSVNVLNFPETYSGSITNLPEEYSVSGSVNIVNFPETYSGSITNLPETYSGSITNLPTEYPISGSVNIVNFPETYSGSITNLPEEYVVSGSVNVVNFPETYSGSITNLPTEYPISGSVNVVNFPETYSGSITNLPTEYPISGSVNVLNFPETYSGSITNLPVEYPISGSVNVLNFPDTQEISGSVNAIVSGSLPSVIYNTSGCPIGSQLNSDGDYHLSTAIIQKITDSLGNTSSDQLDADEIFVGTADSTYGATTIQTFLYSDQNSTLFIEQGVDGVTWEVSDEIPCLENVATTRQTLSVAPYFRIRVRNDGGSTTTKFVVAAAMTPVLSILPRNLSDDGRLKSESTLAGRENTERHVWVNPTNELAISPVYRMVGTAFDGSTKDPNFWTDESLRGGTVTQDGGEIELETNTTANGFAMYRSVRKARFVAGSAQLFSGAVNWVTAGTANNTRRVGAYTIDGSLDVEDGFYFQLSGTTFSVGYARAGTPVLVNSGSFNGNLGAAWTPTADYYYKVSIEFTPMGCFWYIGGSLLHKIRLAHAANTMTVPITIENENTGNSTADVVFDSVGLYIARQGELETNPTSKYLSGVSTTICKYGAGVLKGAILGAIVNGADINIYDGLSTAGTLIWASGNLSAKVEPASLDFFGLPFSDGLTIEIADSSADVLIIYE